MADNIIVKAHEDHGLPRIDTMANSRPNPTQMLIEFIPPQLLIESLKETIREYAAEVADVAPMDDVADIDSNIFRALAIIVTTGGRGVKIAALVAAGLIGAAVVLPPIIRAFRD